MTPPRRARGFALVTALFAAALLAGLAYDITLQNRTAIVEAQAQYDRARLEMAANSAFALAVLRESGAERWAMDGAPHHLSENGIDLTVRIEDERAKIPLNLINPLVEEDQKEARRMFEAAGARGRQLDQVTDSFLDWRDDDSDRRPFGAESKDYAARGYRARDGDLNGVDELALLPGMTPALLDRLRPEVTLWFGETGGFVSKNAGRIARVTMLPDEALNPQAEDSETTRSAFSEAAEDLRGRRITVHVSARDVRGGALQRDTVFELSGNPRDPMWVREQR